MKLENRREMPSQKEDGDGNSIKEAPKPIVSDKEQEYLNKLKALDETHGGI